MNTIDKFNEHVMHTYGRFPLVMEKGQGRMCTDENGKKYIDFGSGIGFNTRPAYDKEYTHGVLQKALNKAFSPEFLNRIDDIIMFDQLSKEAIFKIIDIELAGFYKRLAALGYTVTLSDEAKNFIASKGCRAAKDCHPGHRIVRPTLDRVSIYRL